jgi:putative isomerase
MEAPPAAAPAQDKVPFWQTVAYGFHADAQDLARKTFTLLERDLQQTGTIHECYHPDSGAPNFNADFLSWNVLALLMR